MVVVNIIGKMDIVDADGKKFKATVEVKESYEILVSWVDLNKSYYKQTCSRIFNCFWWNNEDKWMWSRRKSVEKKNECIPEYIIDMEDRLNVWLKNNKEKTKEALKAASTDFVEYQKRQIDVLTDKIKVYEDNISQRLECDKKFIELYK